MIHDDHCERSGRWFKLKECREFSTDGTRMGAEIAHTFGTTDEEAIMAIKGGPGSADIAPDRDIPLGQVDEEQADWESEEWTL